MRYPLCIMIALSLRHLLAIVCRVVDVVRTFMLVKVWGLHVGRGVVFRGPTIIQAHNRGQISIGNNVKFVSRGMLNHVGLTGPTILSCVENGSIMIGNGCGLSSPVIVARKGVRIGNNVLVGGNVRIFDNDFHELDHYSRRFDTPKGDIRSAEIEIGDDVFVGANAIILKGTKIGPRSIVAAGSVVFGLNIPADAMVKGNPAVVTSKAGERTGIVR